MNDWDIESPSSGGGARKPGGSSTSAARDPSVSPAVAARGPGPRPVTSRRRSWLLLALAGLVLLVAGALSGFYLARSYSSEDTAELLRTQEELGELQAAQSATEQRNSEYYRQLEALKVENEGLRAEIAGVGASGSSPTSATTPGAPLFGGAYGDGVYLVGEDLLPGTYDGIVVADVGYWARLRSTDGAVGSIIANALVRGPFVLTVVEADRAVELRGVEITPR